MEKKNELAVEPFDFDNENVSALELGELMKGRMERDGIFSTNAWDVGYPANVIAIMADEPWILFNPRVAEESEETVKDEEFFSARPGFSCKIERPVSITLRATNFARQTVSVPLQGQTARCVLHELDKLSGMDPVSRATKITRDMAERKFKKIQQQQIVNSDGTPMTKQGLVS